MSAKKIVMERNQEFVHLDQGQHSKETAGLKPPRIRSQTTPRSWQPQSPFSPATHAGLNPKAPAHSTPATQSCALRWAEDTEPLSAEPAVKPLSKKLVKMIDALSGDTKGKTPSRGAATEHNSLDRSDDELAPLHIDWLFTNNQSEEIARKTPEKRRNNALRSTNAPASPGSGDGSCKKNRTFLKNLKTQGSSGKKESAFTPVMLRSKSEDHDAKGSGVKRDAAPANTRNAEAFPKPFSACNKENGGHRQENADPHSIFWNSPELPLGSNEFLNWASGHPVQSLFNQVYPMTEMANGSSQNGGFYPMHTVLAGNVLDAKAFFNSLCNIVPIRAADELPLGSFRRQAESSYRQTSGIMREQAHFFTRFFDVLIQLKIFLEQRNAAAGSHGQRVEEIVEELRQEWLKTDFNHLLGKIPDKELELRPVRADNIEASPRKRPKLTHGRPEAEKAKEQKQHEMHGGAGKQDVFPEFKPTSRKSNFLSRENFLADPDFPIMPELEIAVSQYQFSLLSPESSGAPTARAQPLSLSATSPAVSRVAHTGSTPAALGSDQPGVSTEIKQGHAHSLKRKWDESDA
jgi:hypothetical protein